MAGQIVNQAQTATPGTPVTVLHVNTTSQATTGTSEEVLATYTLPANTLSANGKAIRVTAWFVSTADAVSKTARIRFGGIGGTVVATNNSSAASATHMLTTLIVRSGAATQESVGSGLYNGTATNAIVTSPTQTLSGAIDIVATGTTPSGAGQMTFKGLLVEALN